MDDSPVPALPDGVRLATLTDADAGAAARLGHEAFRDGPMPPADDLPTELRTHGLTWTGAFVGDELAGVARDRHDASWFGGASIPTAGIAGVSVAAEHRGSGVFRPLMIEVLRRAAARGAAVSTLFPTAPGIYRGLGFEVIGGQDTVEFPTSPLSRLRADPSILLRRATTDDFPAVQGIYTDWARRQNGPLTRDSPLFATSLEHFPGHFTGVTLACAADDPATVLGFCCWTRTGGYTGQGRVEVADLLAATEPARRSLLAMLGSFAAVADRVALDTSGPDPVRLLLPSADCRVSSTDLYMLRVLDPVAALEARQWPRLLDGSITVRLTDEVLSAIDGTWRISWWDGKATVQGIPGDDTDPVHLGSRGLALLYSGAQPPTELRSAGLLQGGSEADDELLTAAFAGRQVHIRDYF